jgi:hypothetical protein
LLNRSRSFVNVFTLLNRSLPGSRETRSISAGQLVKDAVETLQRGGTLPNFVTGGYDKDVVRSSPFGAGATPEAINAAKTALQAMKSA